MIYPLLEARAKKCTKFCWFFGGWENLVFCFRYLLTFSKQCQIKSGRLVKFFWAFAEYLNLKAGLNHIATLKRKILNFSSFESVNLQRKKHGNPGDLHDAISLPEYN